MPFSDLREFVCKLDEVGELAHVRKEVDPKYEVGAICKTIHDRGRQALLFEKVRGCSMPVVTELLGTFKRIGIAIGADEHDLFTQVMERTRRSIEPNESQGSGVGHRDQSPGGQGCFHYSKHFRLKIGPVGIIRGRNGKNAC